MKYTPLTAIIRSTEMRLSAAALALGTLQEGTPLVFGLENGLRVVTPSAGAGTEKFAGFASSQTSAAPVLPTDAVRVIDLVANASGVVTLPKAPISGQVSVVNANTGAPIAVDSVTGVSVDLTVAAASVPVRVTFRHLLTVGEAVSRVGHTQPGGYAGTALGQTGVDQQGVVYTDRISAAVNWGEATAVKLAAGGLLTDQSGSGVAIDATVVAIPSADYPFLGLQFNTI